MTLSELAVRRPVLAAVASLLLLLFGLAALRDIPVRELPDVEAAIVTVTTNYQGAAPDVMESDITEVIEGAVAAIEGLRFIESESRQGVSEVKLEFGVGQDLDVAASDVRDAIGRVRRQLPDAADAPVVKKNDADSDPVMRLAVTSDRMSTAEITDYFDRNIADRLATVPGVANLRLYGQRPFAVRIWLDKRALAARKLTVADVESALQRNNLELPAGEIKSDNRQMTVRLNSRLTSVDDFRDVVIDRVAGYPVRLGDVARVALGVEDTTTIARSNGREVVGMAVNRQSQSNTLQISRAVRAEIEAIRPTLPPGMDIVVGSDDALFVSASIREVLIALSISVGLVVLVILVFLRSARATLIPAITIPVSLVGCFVLISAWGFSLNILTLLALLLAIGLVVDDAIVVLENIQRRIERGESPLVATYRGTRQVTFAVIATSLTLIAVFVPLSFMPGQVGQLFVEFGWVLAGTVVISTFVALTTCPALASKLLVPTPPEKRRDPDQLGKLQRGYRWLVENAVRAPIIVLALAGGVMGGAALFYEDLPRDVAPKEDRGVGFIPLTAPQGSTVEFSDQAALQTEALLKPFQDAGLIDTIFTFTGWGNRAWRSFVVFRLVPWDERDSSVGDLVSELIPKMREITIARGFPITPSGLGLRSSWNPVRVIIAAPDRATLMTWADTLLERAETIEGLVDPELNLSINLPQLDVEIDRARADDLGISAETVAQTLQTLLASREVTGFVSRGREYPVILQAEREDRASPSDINNIFVRAGDGETLVPLGALVTLSENAATPSLQRFARLPALQLKGKVAPGENLGNVLERIESAAAEVLPRSVVLDYSGPSREFKETSSGFLLVLALSIVIVFLVLAANFESFVHPVTILLTVPAGVAGAIYAMVLSGLSLNIYSQIGIILLVGLVAKNGILIVEFANQLRADGLARREAVIRAAVLRLRPILMTVISTVLGALPLVLATGAGAESRESIGTVIIGGLVLSTLLMLVVTPVLYDLLARFTPDQGALERRLDRDLDERPAVT